jgi:hypothetical protein
MINIISTFYISKYNSNLDILRSKELEDSFIKNLNSQFVEKLHLFIDDIDALNRINILSNNSDKVKIIEVGKKPQYSDFFKYIIDNLANKICMITNADIFLYECDNNLINMLKENKIAYALTRHEYNMSHPLIDNYQGSHDSYIFNSSFIDNSIINNDTNFYQNYPGIETHIIRALCDLGFRVLNPCKQIKIVHLHQTDLRNHGKWIGLHTCGDDMFFRKSCWNVPPVILDL